MKIPTINDIVTTLLLVFCLSYIHADPINSLELAPDFNLINKATIQIIANKRSINIQQPWSSGYFYQGTGSGFIINHNGNKSIISNAHVIKNAVSVRLRKVGSDNEFDARVAYISDQRDLAIISPLDDSFFDDTESLLLKENVAIGERVASFGFPVGGKTITMTEGVISRIDFGQYAQSGFGNLLIQIDAALNPGISGGPAISNNEVVGVNFQGLFNGTQNIGYIIPSEVINQFLADIDQSSATSPYVKEVPFISINVIPLQNKQLQKIVSLEQGETGVLITGLSGLEKEKGLLKINDVLMSVDNMPIGNQGNVNLYTNDNISWQALISKKQIGDDVQLKVKREGKIILIDYPLTHNYYDSFIIPGYTSIEHIEYIVIGGLVAVELSQAILDAIDLENNPQFSLQVKNFRQTRSDTEQRIVLISNILYNSVNAHYENYTLSTIDSVNGEKINNIKHLKSLIDQSQATDNTIILNCCTRWKTPLTIGFIWDDLKVARDDIIEEYGPKRNVY